MATTPTLNLPLIAPAQAQKHVTHNEALDMLDRVVQLSVQSRGLSTPSETALKGQLFIVGDGAQNDWAGHETQIAVSDGAGHWDFMAPRAGWISWVEEEGKIVLFDGGTWSLLPSGEAQGDDINALRVGINAAADETNRLSLSSEASLFNHSGAGHRLKINKASQPDTASLLFQSAFSGHAEIGLAGSKDLSFKVSDNGASWTQPITMRANLSYVGINEGSPSVDLHISQTKDYQALRISGYDDEASDYLDLHVGGALSRIKTNKTQMWFIVGATTPLKLTSNSVRIAGDLDMDQSLTIKDNKFLRFGSNWDYRLYYSDTTDQLLLSNSGSQTYLRIKKANNMADFDFNNASLFVSSLGNIGMGTNQPMCRLDVDGAIKAKAYNVVNLPDATLNGAGAMIYVPDESGGAIMAFSDGSNWRRISDRSIVS